MGEAAGVLVVRCMDLPDGWHALLFGGPWPLLVLSRRWWLAAGLAGRRAMLNELRWPPDGSTLPLAGGYLAAVVGRDSGAGLRALLEAIPPAWWDVLAYYEP